MQDLPRISRAKVLFDGGYGRTMARRLLAFTNGRREKYHLWWYTKRHPCMIFAITKEQQVVVTRQFRAGAGKSILEFPGGCPATGESGKNAVTRELLEESGFEPRKIVDLNIAPWTDAPSCNTHVHFYLGLNARKVCPPACDPVEPTEVILVPIQIWYEMIFQGKVECAKTMALSLLALPHLLKKGFEFK